MNWLPVLTGVLENWSKKINYVQQQVANNALIWKESLGKREVAPWGTNRRKGMEQLSPTRNLQETLGHVPCSDVR